MIKRVLSVGQCGADHGGISRALRAFGVEVAAADTILAALTRLRDEAFDLVLVNRVFDADGSPGLELVRLVKADEALKTVPVMLVSNYADAQEQAVAAGAEPGFGKADLGRPAMLERVRPFLA
jgi:two-component system chemotaxis response regulator CheY